LMLLATAIVFLSGNRGARRAAATATAAANTGDISAR